MILLWQEYWTVWTTNAIGFGLCGLSCTTIVFNVRDKAQAQCAKEPVPNTGTTVLDNNHSRWYAALPCHNKAMVIKDKWNTENNYVCKRESCSEITQTDATEKLMTGRLGSNCRPYPKVCKTYCYYCSIKMLDTGKIRH